jgi:hypothetical protein
MGVKRERKILKASVLNLNKILKCTLLIRGADPESVAGSGMSFSDSGFQPIEF